MFENTSKNIDDILYKDAGADSELDYIGQTSWVLFLRHLHELKFGSVSDAKPAIGNIPEIRDMFIGMQSSLYQPVAV